MAVLALVCVHGCVECDRWIVPYLIAAALYGRVGVLALACDRGVVAAIVRLIWSWESHVHRSRAISAALLTPYSRAPHQHTCGTSGTATAALLTPYPRAPHQHTCGTSL